MVELNTVLTVLTLYHYTTPISFDAIKDSGVIRASQVTQADAAFGSGVYLTALSPTEGQAKIAGNNWDGGRLTESLIELGKVDCAITVKIPMSDPKIQKVLAADRDIYLYGGDLYLEHYEHEFVDIKEREKAEAEKTKDTSDETPLYYYGTPANYEALKTTPVVRARQVVPGDPEGVYLTTIVPWMRKYGRGKTDWEQAKRTDRGRLLVTDAMDHAVQVCIPTSDENIQKLEAGDMDIYLYEGDLNLDNYQHAFIKVDVVGHMVTVRYDGDMKNIWGPDHKKYGAQFVFMYEKGV